MNYIREIIINDIKYLVEYYKIMLNSETLYLDDDINGITCIINTPFRKHDVLNIKTEVMWESLDAITLFRIKSSMLDKKCYTERRIDNTKLKVRIKRDIKIRNRL